MCSCGGRINGKMSSGDSMQVVARLGGAIIAGAAGFKAGEIATQHIEFMKKDKLTSGLVKVGAAIGTAVLMPDIVSNEWGTGALVGIGISGGNDLLSYAGINGIGSTGFNESRYLNPNAYNRNALEMEDGVRVEYK